METVAPAPQKTKRPPTADPAEGPQPAGGPSAVAPPASAPAQASMLSLLRQRRFGPFFLTQFLGAFNDNVFKNALLILIVYQSTEALAGEVNLWTNLCAGLFILPYFLFSATAGQLADKFEKARLIRCVKVAETVLMVGAAAGFYFRQVPLLIGVLFLMGTQSTLFGPVKYSILPQHLKREELVGGNGWVEMGTFLAILLGTLIGGVLIGLDGMGRGLVAGALVVVAVLGYLASRCVPEAPAADPGLTISWNPLRETMRTLRLIRRRRPVWLSILGISWFWFYGALVLAQLPVFAEATLGGSEQVVTLLLALFSVGIGAGSLLCKRLSGDCVELGLVPFGAAGLTLFGMDLFFASPEPAGGALVGALGFLVQSGSWRVALDVVMIGSFGGFFIVPLYAFVQERSDARHLARVIAGANIVNAAFMVAAAVVATGLLAAGLTIPQLFLATALMNLAVAAYLFTLLPEFLMRFCVWLLVSTVYRVEAEGLEHIPKRGGALLVCNHVSFVDALIIGGRCRRPVRFVMDYGIYNTPGLRWLFRLARVIPVASARRNEAVLEAAYDRIAAELEADHLVCIFPEGQVTRDGELSEFRPGVERIVARTPVPVVPMALQGLWGSLFSRKERSLARTGARDLCSSIGLCVGAPLAPERVTAPALEQTVHTLRGAWR